MGKNTDEAKREMKLRRILILLLIPALLLGVSAFAGEDGVRAKETAAIQKPEPGSPGDTLTREDARMALLVYKLLDKDGKPVISTVSK